MKMKRREWQRRQTLKEQQQRSTPTERTDPQHAQRSRATTHGEQGATEKEAKCGENARGGDLRVFNGAFTTEKQVRN